MIKTIFLVMVLCIHFFAQGQDSTGIVIKDIKTEKPLPGATIHFTELNQTIIANDSGFADCKIIPPGTYTVAINNIGYSPVLDTIVFPLTNNNMIIAMVVSEEEDMEAVIIYSTRTSRTIENTPTRVETIDEEEIAEKSNMRPSNVAMLLHESTGLQVQQTSATSGNSSIRVQGLDGRYTQLLKDGYPNFGNFASGLSILEIPPLDLAQVEIIKGPSSTLYGGGAIAGVINFISKTPKEKAVYNFIVNQSNIGQTNIGGFAAQKFKKFGYTMLALVNFQKEYDVDKDDFSELPKTKNFTINPKLFFYPDNKTTIVLGNSFTKGSNTGGDMFVIENKADDEHVYFEKNNTVRNTSTLELERKLNGKSNFRVKQGLAFFDREINIPDYTFAGTNTNSFTDISLVLQKNKHLLNGGVNIIYDKFRQKESSTIVNQNSNTLTGGLYLQDTWDVTERVIIEAGARFDAVKYENDNFSKQQAFLLPRISALFKISEQLSSRIGAGLGYKVPTIFTEQTESIQYRNVLPLDNVTAEKSVGITADINYRRKLGNSFSFSINQLFFHSIINKPMVLAEDPAFNYFFYNAEKPVRSSGFETNIKLIYKEDLKLFAGYTYTYAKASYLQGNNFLPLVPRNKLNLALLYEKENNFKLGLEGYFTDAQWLTNGSKTPSFWEFGFMAEKTFRIITCFINFENFTDERQSKYKSVVNPPHDAPVFDEIWNHTEGFMLNGGIKLKF